MQSVFNKEFLFKWSLSSSSSNHHKLHTACVFRINIWMLLHIFTSIIGQWWHVRDGLVRGFLRQASGILQHSLVQPSTDLLCLSCLCGVVSSRLPVHWPSPSPLELVLSFWVIGRAGKGEEGRKGGGFLPKNVTTAHLCGWIDEWTWGCLLREWGKKGSER